MAHPVDLRDAERRAQRYWTIDGLPELLMGTLWIVWGAAFLAGEALPRGRAWNFYWMFTPAVLAFSGVAAVWMIKQLKVRITFPRTGYVEWKEPSRSQRLLTAAVAMLTAALLVVIISTGRARAVESVAAPALGVILGLGFLVASIRQRAPYLLALAAVALTLAIAFGTIASGWYSVNWMFIALGAAAVVVGTIRLRIFLRKHPLEPAR
jgi:hypothetical protein